MRAKRQRESVPVAPGEGEEAVREDVLLTAAVDELRERAERLHEASEDLAAHNARLIAAQRELEDERARYRELFELAPDAFLLTDTDGIVVEANDRATALLTGERGVLVGRPLAAFVEAASSDEFQRRLVELAKAGGRRTAEVRIGTGDGPMLDVEARVATVAQRSDGGRLLWLLRDVTERVGRARELGERLTERTDELERTRGRRERERVHVRDLFERLEEGVIGVDERAVVAYANESAQALFMPMPIVVGEPLPEPWPNVSLKAMVASLFSSSTRLRDVDVTAPDGRLLTIRGIPAVGSGTAGLVVTDVSTRERRERAEREFVANAAHELRTPLTAITGAIEVLQAGAKEDPGERDRFLAHIERECARLGRLSTALLVLARAQMGVEPPRLELVSIRPVLDVVASETRPARGVELDVSCPPDLAVFANRTLIEQALGNLVSNAAKHTQRGRISLRGSEEDDWVSLEVADTGPGIAPDAQIRATERFYRSGGAEGFGLGLAIASESARAIGGRLELDSEPGRGTTARLVLPSAQVVTRV